LLAVALSGRAVAQSYDNPSLGETPVATHPQDYKPLGIRAGTFMLHPGVQLAAEYTDNALYTGEDKSSDTIYHVRPYITAQSNWSRHALNMRLAADIARYQDLGYRDYEDYFLLVSGRVDVKSRAAFSYNLDYMNLHEGLNTRDAEQGLEPTRYDLYGAGVGYDHAFNRLHIGLNYSWRHTDYDDAVAADGSTIDNQDRDRDTTSFSLRAGYQFQTDKQVFVSVAGNEVKYDQFLDRNGYNRNSSGYTANAGLNFLVTGLISGDVFVSYHEQDYDDPALLPVSGWAGGMGLSWRPTQLTSVGARISSSIEETTSADASGYFSTLYALRVDHELRRDLQISGQISFRDSDYQLTADAPAGARNKDKTWRAGIGATYFFNRHVFLSASYDYSKLTSNIPRDGYEANRVWVVLSVER
jgi:hypothetical protein